MVGRRVGQMQQTWSSVSSMRFFSNPQRVEWTLIGGLMLLAFAIRMIGIDHSSLWTDEGYSLWFSRQPIADLWGPIARNEYNPTLYYILLNLWTDVFGESKVAIRSLSTVINVLALPFVYFTARWAITGPKSRLVAILSAGLFTLAFEEILFAQEARTYCLCVLAIAMAAAGSTKITSLAMADGAKADTMPVWPFVLLGAGCALAMWSHYTTAIFIAVIGLFHAGLLLARWRVHGELFRNYIVAAVVFLGLGGRTLWIFAAYALPASGDFWITVPTIPDLIDASTMLFGGAFALESWSADIILRTLLFAPWPLIGVFAAWRTGDATTRVNLVFLLAVSVGAFVLFLAVTYLGKPVFLQRVVLPVQIGWIVLCAMAVLAFESQRFSRIAAGLLVTAFGISSVRYLQSIDFIAPKEPWQTAIEMIVQQADTGETIHVSASGEILAQYYIERSGRSDLIIRPMTGSMRTPPARPAFSKDEILYIERPGDAAMAGLAAHLSETRPAWLLVRNPHSNLWQPAFEVMSAYDVEEIMLHPGPLGLYRVSDANGSGTQIAEGAP